MLRNPLYDRRTSQSDNPRRAFVASAKLKKLTHRQRQVLQAMSMGMRNRAIAAHLNIDEKTVKVHRAAMLARIGVTTSAEAITILVEASFASSFEAEEGGQQTNFVDLVKEA